jgi:broad specificity phosphatase PhoE
VTSCRDERDVLTIVRHGRTEANASGLLLGRRLDPGLDELGRQQAVALGSALPEGRVISSPLRRTRETAEAFGRPVEIDERWIELDYGDLDGTPLRDVSADVWSRWRQDPAWAPAGGESLVQLGERVREACEAVASEAREGDVIVVTHVSPVKAALAWALGVGDEISFRAFVAPASITTIATRGPRPSLHSFNGCAHLDGL